MMLTDEQYQASLRAGFDQRESIRNYIAKLWPHNAHLINDGGIEFAAMRVLQEIASLDLSMGRLDLYWKASGGLYALDYGRDIGHLEYTARHTAPWAAEECDRCTRPSEITSLLLMAAAEVVGLVLCERCTREFEAMWQPVRLIRR